MKKQTVITKPKRAITRAQPAARKRSVQVESPVPATQAASGIASSWSVWSFLAAMDECPPYWSRARDQWLREFVYRTGNDLLAGVMATAVNKCVATGFVLEGPERTVNLYRDIILRKSEFGAGYAKMMGKDAFDFFSQDSGGFRERIRTSQTDTTGAALGFAHFDAARCYLTGQSEFPVEYVDQLGIVHRLHYSQVQRYTDTPSPQETMYGVGFCSVSRAITTAHILVDIARYKRERLSDLPPAGILLLNNLEKTKWEDMESQYNAQERNKNNTTWRNVMIAFGLDPAIPATAELFEFSRLPEHFNEPEAVRIAILSLALAFNMDVSEIWSILGGQMGSAKEADIQHIKARAKGPGAFLTETERGWNDGLTLPTNVTFKYDFADVEEDQLAAQIADTKATTIRKLWEPTAATGQGIITTEEARQWLQLEGLVSDDLMNQGGAEDEATAEDVEAAKSMIRVDDSPLCKAYSDGRMVRLERRPQVWQGVSLLKSYAEYRREVAGMARQMWSGGLTPFEFTNNMFSIMRRNFTRAWREGAKEVGIKPDDIGDDAMLEIQAFTSEQAQYLPGFVQFIQANNKDSGAKLNSLDVRIDMWANRYKEVINMARLFHIENQPLEWVMNPLKENCSDCAMLNGRVYSKKTWDKYGLQPQSHDLECRGFLCGCKFKPTDKPVTRGAPPKLVGSYAASIVSSNQGQADQLASVL